MLFSLGKRAPQGAPIRCNWCRVNMAVQTKSGLLPPATDLLAGGAIAAKRLGWFCGRRCVTTYEVRFRVILEPESVDVAAPHSA
jgi:hypothetical protein